MGEGGAALESLGLSYSLILAASMGPVSSGPRSVGADKSLIVGLEALSVMSHPGHISANQPGLSALERGRKPPSSGPENPPERLWPTKGQEERMYVPSL